MKGFKFIYFHYVHLFLFIPRCEKEKKLKNSIEIQFHVDCKVPVFLLPKR